MRFMMLVKASAESEAGVMPSKELIAAMTTYNEEMAKAGVMLAGEASSRAPGACGSRSRAASGW